MSEFDFLLTSKAGMRWGYREDAGQGATFIAEQDIAPALEHAQAQNLHNDGYSPDKSWRRCATIPVAIQLKWLTEEGWDCLSPDPDCQRKLAQKLDDPSYMYLRTAHFRIGDHWRHSI